MKIYITGIAGFLGSNLAKFLLLKGYDVKGNDSMIGGYKSNIPNNIDFHKTDCANFDEMKENLKGTDILYHCAATAYEGLSVFSPSIVTQNIYQNSVATFSAAISAGVKKIIFCSSMARYGSQEYPFKEEMDPRPQDPYGIAKVAAEKTLQNLCDTHGIKWVVLVPHNIIGPNQIYDDPYRNVLSIFLNRIYQNKPPIIYGDGSQKRCFSYVDDCIYCLEQAMLNKNAEKEIINIGPDEEFVSIKELADKCLNLLRSNLDPIHIAGRPQEVKYATCSAEKARKLLNYQTSTSLDSAIEKTAEYIKNAGSKEFKYHLPLEIINEQTPSTWKDKLM